MSDEKEPPKPKATKKGSSANGKASAPPKGKADHLASHQWKSGCPSPNRAGRPKGSKNAKTLVTEAFLKPAIPAMINGRKKKLSKREAGYHQVGNKAAQGDLKAFDRMNELIDRHGDPEEVDPTALEHEVNLSIVDHYHHLYAKFIAKEAGHE